MRVRISLDIESLVLTSPQALCTEAALNAVQRTYPQIYKTNERLVIEPKTIDVTARDFIVSQKSESHLHSALVRY